MPKVIEKKTTSHTKVTQRTKTNHTTTTTKTTITGKKPASTTKRPAPPRRILNSTPTKPKATNQTTRRPAQNSSTKIVPARMTQLQTMAMRPIEDGRSEWKLEVKGPTSGKKTVERGVAVRSGDKITTALFRVEHLNNSHRSGGSTAGRHITF